MRSFEKDLWLSLLRVHQWPKNLVVLAPAIFLGRWADPGALALSVAAALLFCLASSGIYLVNDSLDAAEDRAHPHKRFRPVASGRVRRMNALLLSFGLLSFAVGVALATEASLGKLLTAYVLLGVAYSLAVKRLPLAGSVLVSAGFVLRLQAGAAVLHAGLSPWLPASLFFFTLVIGLMKRQREAAGKQPGHVPALGRCILPAAGAALACFTLYAASPAAIAGAGRWGLLPTLPLAMFALTRYLRLSMQQKNPADPSVAVYTDRPVLLATLAWLVLLLCLTVSR